MHTATIAVFERLEKPKVDYFLAVTSISCAWMTDLVLCNIICPAAELTAVSRIVNLRFLQVLNSRENRETVIDDGILRSWAQRAISDGASGHLGFLAIVTAPGITQQVFGYLEHFPALDTLVLSRTSVEPKHQNIGKGHGGQLILSESPNYGVRRHRSTAIY